jgi:sulfur carrier protein
MEILVNGEPTALPEGATVATAVAGLELPSRGIAVALDREVVPRGRWESTPLVDGARVEVVHAVQGG